MAAFLAERNGTMKNGEKGKGAKYGEIITTVVNFTVDFYFHCCFPKREKL